MRTACGAVLCKNVPSRWFDPNKWRTRARRHQRPPEILFRPSLELRAIQIGPAERGSVRKSLDAAGLVHVRLVRNLLRWRLRLGCCAQASNRGDCYLGTRLERAEGENARYDRAGR